MVQKKTVLESLDVNSITAWLLKQGIAIVVLICAVGFLGWVVIKQNQRMELLEASISSLNEKLIECEKSKIEMYWGEWRRAMRNNDEKK